MFERGRKYNYGNTLFPASILLARRSLCACRPLALTSSHLVFWVIATLPSPTIFAFSLAMTSPGCHSTCFWGNLK
ncbi:hypothetical protein GQ53DRAFT_27 [Thozetella sp. PMI_491]|nr:hypothetical protein GQ53DRAFT_27 [Thozetella sp. PMI_491]